MDEGSGDSGCGEGGEVDWGNMSRPPKGQEPDALGSVLLSQPGSTDAREALSSRIRAWPSPQGITPRQGAPRKQRSSNCRSGLAPSLEVIL